MKLTFNKIFFACFVLLWAAIVLVNFFTPKKTFSENENKYLMTFPKFSTKDLINGKFMQGIDDYVNDHFILRDNWISVQSVSEYALGKRESNGIYIGKSVLLNKPPVPDQKIIEKNIEGVLFFLEKYNLPGQVMLVPHNAAVETDKLPYFADIYDEKALIADIYSKLAPIATVNVFDTLYEHRNEYIYYRTDHHWTTYGAYLAYEQYCAALGLTPAPYDAKTVSTSFNGTMYSTSGIRFIQSDTVEAFQTDKAVSCFVDTGNEQNSYDSIYFDEYLSQKDKYAYFLGKNQPLVILHGNAGTGKKLLVFKDSYSHCFAPMLLEHYDEVALLDLRYTESVSGKLNIEDYDNVLFIYSMEVFSTQLMPGKLTFSS